MLRDIGTQFDYDSAAFIQAEQGLEKIEQAVQSISENRTEPAVSKPATPTGQVPGQADGLRDIFDDVDE